MSANANKRWDDETEFFLLTALELGTKLGYKKTQTAVLLSEFLGRSSAALATKLSELSQLVGYCKKERQKPAPTIEAPQLLDHVQKVVTVTVYRVMEFGAFCRTVDNITGLLHISQIADSYIDNVTDYLDVGDSIKVDIKTDHHGKTSFSAKSVMSLSKKNMVRLQLVK